MHTGFSGIIAQEEAKRALLIVLAHDHIGSLLISGAVGTGKSTLLNSVRSLCPDRRIIQIPCSVTEEVLHDRVDTDRLISQGEYNTRSGLLSRMQGCVVLLDNINLFSRSVLNTIISHHKEGERSQYILIAATNPDEGAISSGLLDKFGLFVDLNPLSDLSLRSEIIKQNSILRESFADESEPRTLISSACELLCDFTISDLDLKLATQICREAYVLGHRADILLVQAAATYAALQGRSSISPKDLLSVKHLVLAHRINQVSSPTSTPPSLTSTTEQDNGERDDSLSSLSTPPSSIEGDPPSETSDDSLNFDPLAESREQQVEPERSRLSFDPISTAYKRIGQDAGHGQRVKCTQSSYRGRYKRAEMPRGQTLDIALTATIRAAAPFQAIRRKAHGKTTDKLLHIYPVDYRIKRRKHRTGYTILFLVDASGSMGVKKRMAEVKAIVFELLKTAYVKRDRIGLVTFRADEARTLLPFTRSIARAYNLLKEIRTGGRTPLFLGLQKSLELLSAEKRRNVHTAPILVVFTDGRATSHHSAENQMPALSDMAKKLASLSTKIFVVDSECGFLRLGLALQLASSMQAEYYRLDDITDLTNDLKR